MPGLGSVAIDDRWQLYADPEVAGGWTAAELGSVLVHHVCHILRDHSQRAVEAAVTPADSPLWLRATDAEINDDLIPAGLELPGGPVLPRDFGALPGRLAEEYYALLTGAEPRADDRPRPGGLDCGSGADGQPRDFEVPGGLEPWLADLLQRQVAQEIIRHSTEIGTVPAGLLRWERAPLVPSEAARLGPSLCPCCA